MSKVLHSSEVGQHPFFTPTRKQYTMVSPNHTALLLFFFFRLVEGTFR